MKYDDYFTYKGSLFRVLDSIPGDWDQILVENCVTYKMAWVNLAGEQIERVVW